MKTDVSPVLEIYSEWGNAERDDAPYPYVRHSHGGVWTRNTWQWALKSGLRLGAIASTDDHFGYPGAYRQGLAAVHAKELTREGIFDALKAKRVYGVSGDRIRLDFKLNDHWMGQSIPHVRRRNIEVEVTGWDDIEEIEIVKNNEVIARHHPVDVALPGNPWEAPVLVRIEFGWGPWASLDAARICDWELDIGVEGGTIVEHQPCFQTGPVDETRFDRIYDVGATGCKVTSFTSRKDAFAEDDTKGLVLRLQGSPETLLRVGISQPVEREIVARLGDLEEANEIYATGGYPSESLRVSRVSFGARHAARFEFADRGDGDQTDWYYVRVRQANGHLAWSSPVWVEAKG
jgi:hypothetical protein